MTCIRRPVMRRFVVWLLLTGSAVALSGCIVEPARPGWCYYHPYRCER